MLRICGVATCAAAWRNAAGVFSLLTKSLRVRPAPKLPLSLVSSSTCRSETRTCGAWWRRFMFGTRSVPPAISIARGPSPARIFAASATERGARCSNHGSRSIALGLLAVAVFPRRQHERGFGVRHRREGRGPASLVFLMKGPQHLVRGDRYLVDAHAHRVEDGVRHRRHHGEERSLPHLLCAVWTVRIRILDQGDFDLGHVERRQALVVEHGGRAMHERAGKLLRQAAEGLLLHQRLAKAHVDAADYLAARKRGIERAADVVRDPDLRHADPAGAFVDLGLDDARGKAVRG